MAINILVLTSKHEYFYVKHQYVVSTWFTFVRRCEEAVISELSTIGFKPQKLKVIPVQILYCYLALVLLALPFSP